MFTAEPVPDLEALKCREIYLIPAKILLFSNDDILNTYTGHGSQLRLTVKSYFAVRSNNANSSSWSRTGCFSLHCLLLFSLWTGS